MRIEDQGRVADHGGVAGQPQPVSARAAVELSERAPLEAPTPGAHSDREAPVDGSVPFHSVGFTVSSIGYAVGRRFRETLAPLQLEPREFALLRAAAAAEGQSQQMIGERLQIPASRMVAFVDALEGRSLLERRHNPRDRRTRELHLTPSGRELLQRAFALAAELEADICAGLTGAEREQLLELLHRVGAQVGLAPGVHAASADGPLGCE